MEHPYKQLNSLSEIKIRTYLIPGDLGYVTYMHGKIYKEEYAYGIAFENYVAGGLIEFYEHYDPASDLVWVCEHQHIMIAFLLVMHRENNTAQLRYFIIDSAYRGIGIGKKLMELLIAFIKQGGYKACYLWTTRELIVAAALYKKYGFILTKEKESTEFGKAVIEQRYDLHLI